MQVPSARLLLALSLSDTPTRMRWADLADDERFQWCLHPKVKVSPKAVYIQIKETRRMITEDVDVDAPTRVSVSPVSLSESKANADQSANALGNCKMRRAAKAIQFRETMRMRDEDVDASLLLRASDVGLLWHRFCCGICAVCTHYPFTFAR